MGHGLQKCLYWNISRHLVDSGRCKHIASLLAIAALLVSLWWTRHVEKIPNWLKYVAALLILEGIGAYLTQYLAV